MFDAESIKGREQSSKELLRNAFDALICTSEKLDFQKKSYELFGFNIAAFHHGTKEPVLQTSRNPCPLFVQIDSSANQT